MQSSQHSMNEFVFCYVLFFSYPLNKQTDVITIWNKKIKLYIVERRGKTHRSMSESGLAHWEAQLEYNE